MSTSDSTSQKKKKTEARLPPRRGQVKAKMLKRLYETVVSAFSKSEESHKRSGGEGGGDGRSSASVTSTPSGYSTDANGGNSSKAVVLVFGVLHQLATFGSQFTELSFLLYLEKVGIYL